MFSIGENILFASHKFSKPKIMNSGKKLSKEVVVLEKAENITADYYFTYFSLFVISFFSVDPTVPKDVLIFSFLMVLIIWVYIVNEMYFVNPVLNILRYKSFSIVYHKNLKLEEDDEKEIEEFEIKVFSIAYRPSFITR